MMLLSNLWRKMGGDPSSFAPSRGQFSTLVNDYKLLGQSRQTATSLGILMMSLALVITPLAAQDSTAEATVEAVPVTVTDINGESVTITDASRIITIGGSVTEIAFALGASDQIVARDDSSLYPLAVNDLPSVGYVRQLSAEPVLALNPTLIIAEGSVGPVEAVDQLKASGVTFLVVPGGNSIEGVVSKIETVAAALGKDAEGEALIAHVEGDYAQAVTLQESVESKPRVMFIYARGAGAVSVAGTETAADSMITLAGAENAVTEYSGYQPITAEAVVAVAPDVILLMTAGLESIGGMEGLLEQPGVAQTPAGENGRIVAVEDLYLLGFSTRTGTAVLDLTYLLHDELDAPIITHLRADGRFNTLLRALAIGGQTELLSSAGEYTLFAPTDEAIAAAFPPAVLEGFLSSTISVQATLAYHILDGIYLTDDLVTVEGESLQTLYSEGMIAVSSDESGVTLNETTHIIDADWSASNGVVHVIDSLLLPPR